MSMFNNIEKKKRNRNSNYQFDYNDFQIDNYQNFYQFDFQQFFSLFSLNDFQ